MGYKDRNQQDVEEVSRPFSSDQGVAHSRLIKVRFSHSEKYTYSGSSSTKTFNVYKCECGKEIVKRQDQVRSGRIKSCGCLKKEQDKKNLKAPLNWGNWMGAGRKKGCKGSKNVNKGKIPIYETPTNPHKSKRHYVTKEEFNDMYYGVMEPLETESWVQHVPPVPEDINMQRYSEPRGPSHNKGKKFVDGEYV
jgi:hypothetical protein